jgi:hypothetical protein
MEPTLFTVCAIMSPRARGSFATLDGRLEEMQMKRVLVFTMLLVGFAWSSASAQTTDAGYADALTPSLASVARTMHVTMRRNIVEAAEAVPAIEYSFRPTPDTRTFAQLVGHVINANWFFCSQAKQERPPNSANHEALTDKAALVKAYMTPCPTVTAPTRRRPTRISISRCRCKRGLGWALRQRSEAPF